MEKMFSKTHEWVEADGKKVKVGISDYAQDALGDIVYVGLPMVGDSVEIGKSFADVESVKAVSEVFSPVTGRVIAINEELNDKPELLNEKPYEAWMIEVEADEVEPLVNQSEYEEFVKTL